MYVYIKHLERVIKANNIFSELQRAEFQSLLSDKIVVVQDRLDPLRDPMVQSALDVAGFGSEVLEYYVKVV